MGSSKCLFHPKEEIVAFCSDCAHILCSECIYSKHKGHLYEMLASYTEETLMELSLKVNNELEEIIQKINQYEIDDKNIIKKAEGCVQISEEIKNEGLNNIRYIFKKYYQELKNKEDSYNKKIDELLNEVKDIENFNKESLNKHKNIPINVLEMVKKFEEQFNKYSISEIKSDLLNQDEIYNLLKFNMYLSSYIKNREYQPQLKQFKEHIVVENIKESIQKIESIPYMEKKIITKL